MISWLAIFSIHEFFFFFSFFFLRKQNSRQVVFNPPSASNFPRGNFFPLKSFNLGEHAVSNELWHFPIFPIRLAMLIFPNKSRYGVAPISPYFQSLFITFFFPAYFHSEFIFLSTSRTEWKKNWWVRTGCESIDQHHAYAYRLSLSFLVFRHLSLSLSALPLSLRKLRHLLSRSDPWKRGLRF